MFEKGALREYSVKAFHTSSNQVMSEIGSILARDLTLVEIRSCLGSMPSKRLNGGGFNLWRLLSLFEPSKFPKVVSQHCRSHHHFSVLKAFSPSGNSYKFPNDYADARLGASTAFKACNLFNLCSYTMRNGPSHPNVQGALRHRRRATQRAHTHWPRERMILNERY
ncbi:Unannotated [Lentimonas sp. CC4]|nr:Unannotated [Lentimonas sp. CC4]CAA6684887.1 Unannotated [Lentimonas sp. CC6]CAA7076758.1 Unannotated [Lentimonas sp. CC4]CAA7170844.1 Unannotated [Lentimonas sp. CC21]CAA7179593.1 Unannotated [Lentimonas sp. CC8]